MKTAVKHKMPNNDIYAIVKTGNGGFKVIVQKSNYRQGRHWGLVTPRGMSHSETHAYANNGFDLNTAIELFEKKTKTKIEIAE